jgi:Phosphopantetheine attachment site
VATAGAVVAESDLLRFLRSRLPGYAVPSSITQMPTLPLTPAGKVNRVLLPPPRPRIGPPAGALKPEGDLERALAGIWRHVLGLPRVGRDDNFFEIGGHSMAIIKVQSRLEHVLGRHVPVVDLFTFPTIRDLAGHLAAGGEGQQGASGPDDDTMLLADLRGSRRRRRAGRLAATREKDGSQ